MGIVARWKLLGETWDLRGMILISLGLQNPFDIPCTFNLRKRVSTAWVTTLIWFAYSLADAIATFSVGLIVHSLGDGPLACWLIRPFWHSGLPFCWYTLGVPKPLVLLPLRIMRYGRGICLVLDSNAGPLLMYPFNHFPITSFGSPRCSCSSQGFRSTLSGYVFSISLAPMDSGTFFFTMPDPGPDYAKLMDVYTSKMEARLPAKIVVIPEQSRVSKYSGWLEECHELSDLRVVEAAHNFGASFVGVLTKLVLSFFRCAYEVGASFVGMTPSPFRYLLFGLNYAALVLFYFIEKKEFEKYDIGISYTLLVGAIGLDLISIVMLLLSDWVVVALARAKSEHLIWFVSILGKLLCIDRVRWGPTNPGEASWFSLGIRKIMRRRWSESLSQYNLINYCLNPRAEWLETSIRLFYLTNMLDGMKYVKTLDFTNDSRDHIFEELKMKSELADDLETAKEISSSRGDWILRYENCSDFLRWINDVDFDQSIILWHIATELCYYTDEELKANANDSWNQTNAGNSDNKDIKHNRVVSKRLSDYLLYLLLVHSTMLSSIAGIGKVRFRDTCAEAKKFFRGRKILKEGKNFGKCFGCCFNKCRSKGEEVQHQLLVQACKSILAVNTVAEPVTVKGDRSKSVLFDPCILAKELKKLGRQRMWQIVSKVWVELLSYAACHCRGETHVAQLSKGGQLLTLVSLLMTHLGLGDQFQISKGRARAKLIVQK